MLGVRLGWRVRRFNKDGAKEGTLTCMKIYRLEIVASRSPALSSAYSMLAALTVIFAAWITPLAYAEHPRYIVQFRQVAKASGISIMSEATALGISPAQIVGSIPGDRLIAVRLSDQQLAELKGRSEVELIEPDHLISVQYTPNDPLLSSLYGLIGSKGIQATNAWDTTKGDPDAIVAVIDTGIDYNHPDLVNNVWTNGGETPSNKIDDDGNGYVDDYYGYDFANEDGDPFDDHGHGTHVSGTVAASGDNAIGVVGVAWHSRVLAIKTIGASGLGAYFDIIQGIDYLIKLKQSGVPIVCVNLSLGGLEFSTTLQRAFRKADENDILVVAAAGNSGEDADKDPQYPAAFSFSNIISVAAMGSEGTLASFSNFGRSSVDVGAPGVDILSTNLLASAGRPYIERSGTSMASPHVAGIAALIAAINPELTARQIRTSILTTVRAATTLAGITATGGIVDAEAALADAAPKVRMLEVYGRVSRGSDRVGGVRVRARSLDGSGGTHSSRSRTDGSFAVRGLLAGSYLITASKVGTRFKKRSFTRSVTSDVKQDFQVRR